MDWMMSHKVLMFVLGLVAILLCILAGSEHNTRKNNKWQMKKTSEYPEYKQKDVEHKEKEEVL